MTIRLYCCLLATLAWGCALIVDTDREQCSVVDDCVRLLGEGTYACEQNLCRLKAACTRNAECLEPGRHVCAAGSCVACVAATDCTSSTASCVANVCEDRAWGCLTESDNRPAPTTSTATLNVKVPNAVTMMPLEALTLGVCLDPQIDPSCATPFPGASGSYDAASGRATITGLSHGSLYRLQLIPPPSSGLAIRDFYTNRPARGVESIPDDLGLVPLAVLAGLGSPVPIDPAKPAISVRLYDCQGVPAAGVSVSLVNPPLDLATAYLTESMSLRFDLTQTTKLGYAGFLNVTPGVAHTLSAKIGGRELLTYQFVAAGERTVTIDLYPRIFYTR